jgi:hypothetical protein
VNFIISLRFSAFLSVKEKPNLSHVASRRLFAGFNFESASGSNLIFIDGVASERIIDYRLDEGGKKGDQVSSIVARVSCRFVDFFFSSKLKIS